MRELNPQEVSDVSGGLAPLVVAVATSVVTSLAYKAGKALGRWVASYF